MKVTYLGHASWLLQTAKATVVSDLLVESTFRNGTFTMCPTRELNLSAMPKLDALIITHRHRDHFDLETLSKLDRRTRVLCPNDRVILHALDRLGYARVETFADWSYVAVGDLELIFTPSEYRVPENGILATDGEMVLWNQVDTILSAGTLAQVRERVGQVDLVVHGYQPMEETASLESRGEQFPAARYAAILHRAKLLGPRALVPGSNGRRAAGSCAWFNAFKFPVGRARFVRDVQRVLPGTETFIPNPGDVLVLEDGRTILERQAAEGGFVRTVEDDEAELMAFDPTRGKPELLDDNLFQVSEPELRALVQTLFERRVPEGGRRVVPGHHWLRVLGASLEVRVVYPDRSREMWILDFATDGVAVSRGARGDRTDLVLTLPASVLHGLATGRTRTDIVTLGGQFRLFSRVYRIESGYLSEAAELAPPAIHGFQVPLPALFFDMVAFERDWELRQVEAELQHLGAVPGEGTEAPLWERPAPRPRRDRWAKALQRITAASQGDP